MRGFVDGLLLVVLEDRDNDPRDIEDEADSLIPGARGGSADTSRSSRPLLFDLREELDLDRLAIASGASREKKSDEKHSDEIAHGSASFP